MNSPFNLASLMNSSMPTARRLVRPFVLLALLVSCGSLALVAGLLQAAPLTSRGSTGQALALRAALRAMVPPATHAQTFREMGVPADTRRGPDGRFIYQKASYGKAALLRPGAMAKPRAAAGAGGQVDEAVQTFDVFNPPPTFVPTQGPGLTPTNLTPVWTADETMMVFSSNRTLSGGVGPRYHIWAIPINGGASVQLTDSAAGAGEFFPALSAGNNTAIAFTSDAQSPGTQNLYAMPFTAQTVNVASLVSPTLRANDPLAQAQGGTGFDNVGRPTFNPTNSNEIIFSAHSTQGANTGRFHLYFLYQTTGGFNQDAASLPAKLTDGPADDTDPAYSQDGQLIAFASTSPSLAQTNSPPSSNFNTALLATTAPTSSLRSVFLIGGGGKIGFGNRTNGGAPATIPGTDNFGPAWSSPRRNVYLNPAPGTEYIAFSRGASPTSPHDVFYLAVLQNIDAGGETGHSNEAGTTPVQAVPAPPVANLNDTPVYQINSGGPEVTDPNYPSQDYKPDNFFLIDNGSRSNPFVIPVTVNGGTADQSLPPPVTNLINDPFTPPGVYQTDRSGTFQYTFKFLTPGADYRIRLHLSDPKNSKPAQRVFSVFINGILKTVIVPDPTTGQPKQSPTIDIVQQAQSSPGRLLGLVSDATGNPLPGVTLTVADYTTGAAVATNPSPLVTSAAVTTPPGVASPINYSGGVARGTYLVTATPAAGSGFDTLTQIVNVTSGSSTRADFTLPQGTGTLNGTVTDAGGKVPVLGATITLTDSATGAIAGTSPSPITTGTDGTYTATVPAGTYDVTATPPPTSGYAVSTAPAQVITANATTTTNFALASGAAVGTVGGLVTDSVSLLPIAGATVKFLNGAGAVIAITRTSAATASPAAPNGDAAPINYSLLVPVGAGTLQFSAPGFAPQSQAVTVVNTPATATTPANAFVRANKALVGKVAPTGQNTAVVDEFVATALATPLLDAKGFNVAPAGSIFVSFVPVSGDPPIVQAIELISSSNAAASSSFGGASGTSPNAAPTLVSAIGGSTQPDPAVAAAPRVLLTIQNSANTGIPSSYNVYRTAGAPTGDNAPPLPSPAGSEGSTPYVLGAKFVQSPNGTATFSDTGVNFGEEYFYQVTAVYTQSVTPETPVADAQGNPGANPVVHLNTDDNPGQTSAAGNAYDDVYPTWSPFISVFSIAYSSNRTVTYTNPGVASAQSETAISVGQGQPLGGGATVGTGYAGILESQVLNLDPPTLLPYSGNEILHIADSSGNTTRSSIQPGQPVTVVVRLSSREAGIDNAGGPNGGANVYLQVKDPDSKYQDAQGREHKVFAKDFDYRFQSNNPAGFFSDSGSSSFLMNGGGGYIQNGFDVFPITNFGPEAFSQRGAVGGLDGKEAYGTGVGPGSTGNTSNTISIGRSGGGTNPARVADKDGKPVQDGNKNPVLNLPGSDPNRFIPWGPEYECQVVNPQFGAPDASVPTGAADTAGGDYVSPFYLAGVDDQQPFSGAFKQRPTVNLPTGNGTYQPAEWLQFSPLPAAQQDGQGGVLYGLTWKTPTSGSDYYLDVIAFDKATPPRSFQGAINGQSSASNWRIYDNVWGFSTASSLSNNDILVVSDYALGQKFAATTFGGQRGLLNLVPKLFGAEPYVTDIDVNQLPNAVYRNAIFPGANPDNPQPEVLKLDDFYNPDSQATDDLADQDFYSLENFQSHRPYGVLNGLGVGSYFDRFIDDGGIVDGTHSVRSQQYSLWRVLSRGPVPAAVYKAYEPTIVSQPAVADPGAKGFTNILAGSVPVANRCILWVSPFTGDVLAGPGTLLDANTQADLSRFVGAGGRLVVSGQDVGSALTQAGTANNTAGGFLSTVLGATLASPNAGTHIAVPGPITTQADGRITTTPYFDGQTLGFYPELNPDATTTTVPPSQRLIRVSNNYGGNIFSANLPFKAGYNGNWRTDGSLDQLGPYIQPFLVQQTNNSNAVVAQIDTITPNKGSHVDLNLAPFTNPLPPLDNGNDNAASAPGGVGLIYTENPITATGGTGSKVVYSTFGLEALSTEYYKQTISFKPNPVVYLPRNQRQNILHNVVNYLRTGSISGTIRATTGNGSVGSGVSGVTVYVVDAYGITIPGRGTFSAQTDTAGNFRIEGIDPGNYTLAAYKTGFSRTVSNPGVVFTIEGDSTQTASLTINQSTGGAIAGNVSDGSKPVAGATVTFTSSDGTSSQNTTTDGLGNYVLPNVPPTTYTGVASNPASGGVSAVSAPVTVTANSSATVNFVLKAGPGAASGRVVDASTGKPIVGATVSFSSGTPPAVVATGTTDSTGTYNVTALPAGTYSVTASAPTYGNSLPVSIVITGNQTTNPQDIPLGPAVNGTLGGIVTSTSSTTPVGGVTITIVNANTGVAVPAVTSGGAAVAGPDGAPLNYGPITVAQGTYTVTAGSNGVTTASQSVTVSGSQFSRVDFTGVSGLPPVHTFAAGLNFLSTPYDYSAVGFDAILGSVGATRSHVALWDPTRNVYALDPAAPADAFRIGVGYWVFLKQPVGVTRTGGAPAGAVAVPLHPSWNQIGVPNLSGVLVSSLTFDMGGGSTPLTFANAINSANHVVSPVLYRYDGSGYQPVGASDTLQPWQAYWIKVYTPTTVRIPTGR